MRRPESGMARCIRFRTEKTDSVRRARGSDFSRETTAGKRSGRRVLPCGPTNVASPQPAYLLRLMIEATMAASEAVEDIMPIAFANPLPLGSCFIGTTIWHPGSTAGYRFQRNPPRVEATFPFMYTINGRRRALCLKPPA